jgi:hypothetical protein
MRAAGRTTWQVQVRSLGTTWPYTVPFAALAVGAVLALLSAGSVALAPSIRAARAQPTELLRAE